MIDLRRGSGIYVIENAITGGRYYGSTRSLAGRWAEHVRRLRRGDHHNAPLQAAWNRYGEGALSFRVLAVLERAELRETEQRLLDKHYGTEGCYNVSRDTSSPMAGRKQSPEHTARVAAANRGRKRNPEAVEKTASAHRGRKHTAEHTALVAAALRGRRKSRDSVERSAAAHRGRKRSDETRAKIATAARGRKHTVEARARMSRSRAGMKRTPESIERSAAAHRGKPRTDTERARISAGMTEVGRRRLSDQKRAYWAAWRAERKGAA